MLAVQSNNSSRNPSPSVSPVWSTSPSAMQQGERAYRSVDQDAVTSEALANARKLPTRPSPDVHQNMHQQHQHNAFEHKPSTFSIDSDDLLTPQRADSHSSAASSTSSPHESAPEPSSSSSATSSSPPNVHSYSRAGEHARRSAVASPTFSSDSHRSSMGPPSPRSHSQPLVDELGRPIDGHHHALDMYGQSTVRASDLQGLSPLSPFVEPFSPGTQSQFPDGWPSQGFGLPGHGQMPSNGSHHEKPSSSLGDNDHHFGFPSAYDEFKTPSASSASTPAAAAPHVQPGPRGYHDLQQGPNDHSFGNIGSSDMLSAGGPTAFPNYPQHTGSSASSATTDRMGMASRSSQDSSSAATAAPSASGGLPEEISTIFVVGFPDDMGEREFQNMFIFSPGFEAAILKTPHHTSGGSNTSNSSRDGTLSGGPKLPATSYPSQADQFPMHMMSPAFDPTMSDEGTSSLAQALSQRDGGKDSAAQRKQIIGFAKFRTRQEAADARDVLSGRRVDAEKDCVLKAEMAKKNLHTRRGLANEAPAGASSSVGVGNTAGNSSLPPSVLALGQQNLAIAASLNPSVLAGIAQRSPQVHNASVVAAAHAAGSPNPEQNVPSEGLPPVRNLPPSAEQQQQSAFDAFHSVPSNQSTPSYAPQRLSDLPGPTPDARYAFGSASNVNRDGRDAAGAAVPAGGIMAPGMSSASPYYRPTEGGYGKSLLQQLDGAQDAFAHKGSHPNDPFARQAFYQTRAEEQAQQQQHSYAGSSSSLSPPSSGALSPNGGAPPNSFNARFQGLSLNTGLSNTIRTTSPTSAGLVSPRGNNPADMNPPINTLYVGGLPAVLPSLTGPMSASHLEDSLRAVFSRTPGFKRLCFRQKSK